jgi:hypothetical protein
MSSFSVAPPDWFSMFRTCAVLLPSRAPVTLFPAVGTLAPFFAEVVLLADLALEAATWGFRGAT